MANSNLRSPWSRRTENVNFRPDGVVTWKSPPKRFVSYGIPSVLTNKLYRTASLDLVSDNWFKAMHRSR